MRFYFIKATWIAFILLGLYLILDDYNDHFQTILYAVWILTGVYYYFFSKDSSSHFLLALFMVLATTATIIYYFYFKTWMV